MAKKWLRVLMKEEILKWIDEQVLQNVRFESRAHAEEYAIEQLMENEEELPRMVFKDNGK